MQVSLRVIGQILFLFALLQQIQAQNISKLDSLHKRLSKSSGVERFKILNEIGFEYRLSFPDSTIFYCTQAYDLGQKLVLKKDLSRPLSFIGLANGYKGNYKASFEFHTRAIEIAQEQKDSLQLAYSYNNFGRLFFDQGDMTRAYDNMIKSRTIFEQLHDPAGLAYVYRSLTNIHRAQSDYAKALNRAVQAVELRVQLGDPRALLSALMELGSVYSEINNHERANRCFEQADSIAIHIADKISLAEIRIARAEFLVTHNDSLKAYELGQQAFSMVNEAGNLRLLPRVNLLMGHIYLKLNKLDDAARHLELAIESTEEGHRNIQRDAYLYLSKTHELKGNLAKATREFNKYLVLKESLQSLQLARQIEKLQFQLEIEKIERENELLKADQVADSAVIRQQQLENIILIILVVFVLTLFLVQRNNFKKRNEAIAQLAKQNLQIQNQREEIKEKNSILEKSNTELSDLNYEKDTLMNIVAHDLKSPLNRIKGLSDLLTMEGNLNENQTKYIKLLKDATRSGLDLIGDLLDVNALEANREPKYSFFDLSALINDRITAFHHYALSKSITLQSDGSYNDLIYLDQKYVTRILDNLISNAIKFSPPNSTVQVSIKSKEGRCSIKVKDEGPGFMPEDRKNLFQKFKKLSARPTAGESSNGLGLAIVKVLVERMGGKIELQTEIKKGSTFTIVFPIKDAIPV